MGDLDGGPLLTQEHAPGVSRNALFHRHDAACRSNHAQTYLHNRPWRARSRHRCDLHRCLGHAARSAPVFYIGFPAVRYEAAASASNRQVLDLNSGTRRLPHRQTRESGAGAPMWAEGIAMRHVCAHFSTTCARLCRLWVALAGDRCRTMGAVGVCRGASRSVVAFVFPTRRGVSECSFAFPAPTYDIARA